MNQNNLITNNTIICAVSGGVDSICLLDILYKLGYNVVLAHVNHNKRVESINEQEAMKKLADSLNIPFELLDYHYDGVDNFHNDAHNARYEFFKNLCIKYNTDVIATAHHLDDQAETIIMRLLEGSNLYGYGGISCCNDDGEYKIIRPLLCLSKEELYNYANSNKLTYFEDSSNNEDLFLRNRIRHNIIPLLKNEADSFYTKISQYSNQLKEAFSFIRTQSIDYLNKTNNIIDINSFSVLDIAIKKDIISLMLERYNINKSTNIIEDALEILKSTSGNKKIDLEGDFVFIRSYDKAMIKRNDLKDINFIQVDINKNGVFNNKYKFYLSHNLPLNSNAKYIKLCYNNLELPLTIRSRMDGDLIHLPIGTKKLNRIFIDSKISFDKRNEYPIIVDNNNTILWVYNLVKSKEVIEQKDSSNIYLVCEEK